MRKVLLILMAASFALVFAWLRKSTAPLAAESFAPERQTKKEERVPKMDTPVRVAALAAGGVTESPPALPQPPSEAETMLERGISQINQEGATVQSRELFEQALELNPSSGLALTVLVGSYLDLGEKSRGEKFLEQLAKKSPEHSAMYYAALADLRAAVGDARGSAEASEIAVELDPHSAVAHSLLGSAYLKEGDPRAKETLQRSGELFRDENRAKGVTPSQKQAARELSEVFFREGNTRESERVLEEVGK